MSTAPGQAHQHHRLRAGLLGVIGTVAVLALAALAARATRDLLAALTAKAQVQISDAVTVLALVLLVLALLWSAMLLTACSADLLRPQRVHRPDPAPFAFAPDLALRLTGLLLAITTFGGSTGMAQAVVPDAPVATAPASPTVPVPGFGGAATSAETTAPAPVPGFAAPRVAQPDGSTSGGIRDADRCSTDRPPVPGWTPDRPVSTRVRGGEHVRLLAGCPQDPGEVTEIVVRQGDDLWSLVERHLGASANAARIAEEWPRWYAHNRTVIGDDPNLLLVGQTLQVPTEGALR